MFLTLLLGDKKTVTEKHFLNTIVGQAHSKMFNIEVSSAVGYNTRSTGFILSTLSTDELTGFQKSFWNKRFTSSSLNSLMHNDSKWSDKI